jgi:hypothetical protein
MEAIFIYLRFDVEKMFVQLETGEERSTGGARKP